VTFISAPHGSIDVRVTHHTGRMIGLRRRNLAQLPAADQDVIVELPTGRRVAARFRRNEQNPYIGGEALVAWIVETVPWKQSVKNAVLRQLVDGAVKLELRSGPSPQSVDAELLALGQTVLTRVARPGPREQKQRVLRDWEREPRLRDAVLAVWPHDCQVVGCDAATNLVEILRRQVLEVHHVTHVAAGGDDSIENLTLVCANHHRLLHAPDVEIEQVTPNVVRVIVDGLALTIERDTDVLGLREPG